jgi:hypothetical protein
MNFCRFLRKKINFELHVCQKVCWWPSIFAVWAGLLGCKAGPPSGLCGLVWRVSRFFNELEGHQQTLTLVRKPMVLWLLFNFRKSLVYVPKLCNFAMHILQPLKSSRLHPEVGYVWFKNGFVFFQLGWIFRKS